MKKLWVCAALLLAAVGCKKSDDSSSGSASASGKATGTASASGSANASGSATASGSSTGTASGSAAASGSASGTASGSATAMTGDAMAKRYDDCWGFFNDRKWDDYKGCYAADASDETIDGTSPPKQGADAILKDAQQIATAFPDAKTVPQATLVSDNHVVGLLLITGTNTAASTDDKGQTMPATGKKIGMYIVVVADMNPDGKIKGTWSWVDEGNMAGQLGLAPLPHSDPGFAPAWDKPVVAVASGTPTEKTDLDAHHQRMAAFNKHDIAALSALSTDDVQWYEPNSPKLLSKAEMDAGIQALWKAFSDMQMQDGGEFAAGDWVVHYGQMTGTNDGDMSPTMPKTGKKVAIKYMQIQHYTGGKVDKGFMFLNSLAMMKQLQK